ncbi:hypothetical protein VTO42DRAFT_5453 [Malbranchea cinnamomea]
MLQDIDTRSDETHIYQTFNAGFVFLSYVISTAGCATCLELLHRRTARFGLYNWFLLVTAAIALGGIGMWCMHVIGNRAVILHDGDVETKLSHNSGFTAISFFLPIIVLMAAFYFIGVTEFADWWSIPWAGALTGAAVCGMHYVGQQGISNYRCTYSPGHVVGAAAIAVAASITALGVFFRLRATWSNNWWKRGLTALILAVAATGMHYTASAGTTYHRIVDEVNTSGQVSPAETVIVCTVLACVACVVLLGLAVLGNQRDKLSNHRVRQLVLACAYFDPSGNVMVSPDGSLPTQKITDQYIDRTFAGDDLSKTHPAFIWAFRATRSWPTISTLIPGMKYHLLTDESIKRYAQNGRGDAPNDLEESGVNFELIFKELFCVAAQELATHLNQPLVKLGVLYDDIVITGTHMTTSNLMKKVRGLTARPSDPEAGRAVPVVGKGQFLFAVRHLNKQEAMNLSAHGYRFAGIPQIAHTLARGIQIRHSEMLETLQKMKDYSPPSKMMEPGVHLVCFSLTPSLSKGFDVLVPKNTPNVLPHKTLPIREISQWQQDILNRMDGLTLTSCIRWLKANGGYSEPEKIEFCQQMLKAASRLASYLVDPALGLAKFSSRPIMIPCKRTAYINGPARCTAFSFRFINNLENRVPPPAFCFRPLRLFNAQQQVYPGVPDHDHFRRSVMEEFSHCVEYHPPRTKGVDSGSSASSIPGTPPLSVHYNPFTPYPKNELAKTMPEGEAPLVRRSRSMFGGIVVSSQVTVDVVERVPSPDDPANLETFEMNDLNTTMVEVGRNNAADQDTFVDELCALCALCRANDQEIRRERY